MSIASLYDGIDMNKVMFGENAIHVPINMFFRHFHDGKHAGVFQFDYPTKVIGDYAKKRDGVFILGDAIIRPRVVIATDHCNGMGIGGVYTDGFQSVMDTLHTDQTDVVLENLP